MAPDPHDGRAPRRLLAAAPAVAALLAGAATAQDGHPPFRLLRYEEDYRYLADPARRTSPFDAWKYVPLGDDPDSFASFGGEARTRYEFVDDPVFGLGGIAREDFVLQRFMLHADVHLGPRDGLHGRVFFEAISGLVDGEETPKGGAQDNQLDAQQAFAELGVGPAALRAGRQELDLGSGRLVTVREPTNARLTFDAARILVEAGRTRLDALVARPVAPETGVFDDEADDGELLWGLYATTVLQPQRRLGLDVYYLGIERDEATYDRQRGREVRHSLGARLHGNADGFDHDTEAIVQFGDYTVPGRPRQDILAWTLASHTGHTFADLPMRPRIAVKANIASGDHDPADGALTTFDPLYPRLNYFSDAALFAPLNFFDVHPSLMLHLHDDVTFSVSTDFFFRQSRSDAVYGPRGPVVFGDQSRSRWIGSTTTVQLAWRITPRVESAISYVHFASGDVIEDAGGTDVDFVTAWLMMRF